MRSSRLLPVADSTTNQIDHIIAAVIERGNDDNREETDDYSALRESFEVRKLVIFQLYDSYFPPKRHEHELQLITLLVDAVVAHPTATFLVGAAAGGIIGNASYDILKQLLSRIIRRFKPVNRSYSCFKEIENNADKLMRFFKGRHQAGTREICKALDVEPGKIEPLLMLFGFSRRWKGKRWIWTIPHILRVNRLRKRK
jgi:hypothetical protein